MEFAKFARAVLQIAAQGAARHVLQLSKVGQDADLLIFAQFLFDGRDDFIVVLRRHGSGNAKCGDILRSRK
ncbi:hypothetical protein [Mesorhizobium sp. M1393]|uniref:hypothetical protein n=1 Tax=Mesorhizobium sp. M1393 TaxID=2957094 RepID=UPI00333C821D